MLAVVTAADLPEQKDKIVDLGEGSANLRHLSANVLAHEKVLYKGHAVAAVAADNVHIAEEAVKLIKVEYELLPPVLDVRDAMRADAPVLHDDVRTNSMGKPPTQPQRQRGHAYSLRERQRRRRLRQGRRRGRARIRHGQRAPGLHRAARRDGPVERGRPPDDLDEHARLVHRPAADGRAAAASRSRSVTVVPMRDRRRLRRQDRRLSGAGGGHAVGSAADR